MDIDTAVLETDIAVDLEIINVVIVIGTLRLWMQVDIQ